MRENKELSNEEISKHMDISLYNSLSEMEKIKVEDSIRVVKVWGRGKEGNFSQLKKNNNE